ncbi:MAG: transposase family protein [Myxococcales bacterium]|nr:transposase family protein [Myxococcales bacterium]
MRRPIEYCQKEECTSSSKSRPSFSEEQKVEIVRRYLVNKEESDVEPVMQRAREIDPDERPRLISDNGSQFITRDFKEFIHVTGMTHVRISPYSPQSNGNLDRWHKTLKADAIRPAVPETIHPQPWKPAKPTQGGLDERCAYAPSDSSFR